MTLSFSETANFMQHREDHFATDSAYSDIQQALLSDPQAEPVMRGCGGLRKLRWADLKRGKGKRGGLRVIYLYLSEFQRVIFLDVYDKNEADDLTPEERKEFAATAQEIRLEFQKRAQPKRND